MSELEERAAVVSEAASWLGTPYHHMAHVKGAGVDCAQLLVAVYGALGLTQITPSEIGYYPPDWHLHRDLERYLGWLNVDALEWMEGERTPLPTPLPGDIVLVKFGRCFSHGAIVEAWPLVIHAYVKRAVERCDVSREPWLLKRERKFFTLRRWLR